MSMSRQIKIETDIEVKNEENLKQAAEAVAKDLGGSVVTKVVRYYAGPILTGVSVPHQMRGYRFNHEVGMIKNAEGKLVFVGDDDHLQTDIGREIMKGVRQQYVSLGIQQSLRRLGMQPIARRVAKQIHIAGGR